MLVKKYDGFEYALYVTSKDEKEEQWGYVIYTEGCPPYDNGYIDSEEWFDTSEEARFAAIGHITKLANGEG